MTLKLSVSQQQLSLPSLKSSNLNLASLVGYLRASVAIFAATAHGHKTFPPANTNT
jgi:hypothetical protein